MKLGTAGMSILLSSAIWAQTDETIRKFHADVHAALALTPGAVVADIGSGDDPMHALSIAGVVGRTGRVVCVDITKEALDKLRQKLPAGTQNIEVHLGKPTDPMLERASFDAVLIANAYHEMTDYHTMLMRLREALKPGGRLVVIEAFDNSRRQAARAQQVQHHELSPDLVESELRAAGFQPVSRVEPLIPSTDGTVRYLVAATPAPPEPSVATGALKNP